MFNVLGGCELVIVVLCCVIVVDLGDMSVLVVFVWLLN